ncbi:MAG TPA: tRNA epoxyqueuosine(34) reductase QueG [Bryobacteraceae bacterium]|jgi:epoxyqueuosine reductase
MPLSAAQVKQAALNAGFDLAGIAPADPTSDYARYRAWVESGMAGEMGYLTDRRGELRADAKSLLPSAKTILCVGKRYNSPYPSSTSFTDAERGWISRYAWGSDYHDILRAGLTCVAEKLVESAGHRFDWRVCVDTAPLLERSYARLAGLGWIGRNTCVISEQHGSWFFLGELLLGLDLEVDSPPPERCGSCRRCIDACPTDALVPVPGGVWTLDARRCISYLTIEKRGEISSELQPGMGRHIFGCDICQDVCPWNRRERFTADESFFPQVFAPPLAELARMEEDEFRRMFRSTPVWRAKYRGLLRNVAIAMGNAGDPEFLPLLAKLSGNEDPAVAQAARHAMRRIEGPAAKAV